MVILIILILRSSGGTALNAFLAEDPTSRLYQISTDNQAARAGALYPGSKVPCPLNLIGTHRRAGVRSYPVYLVHPC